MIYGIDDKGVHTLLQNRYSIALFESHLKNDCEHHFKKIEETIDKIKTHHKVKEKTLYVIRDDKSQICKHYKQKCDGSDEFDMLLIKVNWDSGKMAGLQAIEEMLSHCSLSVCLFDGTNKVENIYMSKIDPFSTINYVIYTGVEHG